jgi:hypothetical protein
MIKEFTVSCIPLIKTYSDTFDQNETVRVSYEEILRLCVEDFECNKIPMIGHLYAPSIWDPDIWNNEIKLASHQVKNVWLEKGELKASIEFLDESIKNNIYSTSQTKYYVKICHSQYFTRITKIDILY